MKGVARTPLGVRVVQLVTVCPEGSRCPERGRASTSGKEWVCTRPQDLPCSRAPVRLLWGKAPLALPDWRRVARESFTETFCTLT